MQKHPPVHASARTLGILGLTAVTLATLSACGGDGGGDGTPATVSTISVGTMKYGKASFITVSGTNLNNLSLNAPGCKNVARLSTSPTVSTDTTAYFSCTPSGTYSSTVTATTNGNALASATLTVPPPIVTMRVSGGGNGSVNGTIVFNLRGDKAPITVDNFLAYVNSGFYDGTDGKGATIFHRIVPGFVVQAGGYGAATSGTLPAVKANTTAPIALETTGGSNVQWTASMARTSDPNSATSQFFINLVNNAAVLDPISGSSSGYAVFADVTASAAVVQSIAAATPCPLLLSAGLPLGDGSCVPVPNVTITSAVQTQ